MKKILSCLCAAAAAITVMSAPLNISAAESESEPKLMALTFDDGPNTTTTNEVLDVLEEYNAKASFFLIGDNINEQSAASVKRAYDMGMEINNHSKTHSNMSKMTEDEIKAEIDYVDEKVTDIIGEKTKFFRPPFIDVGGVMYDTIDKPFICGIDCQDYMANVTPQERADYILNGARDGVIVLLHDAAGNDQTVEALKIAMPKLVEQGYEFVTLTELFERQGEQPKGHILYSQVAKYPCKKYSVHEELSSDSADRVSLDKDKLKELGDNYAIEVEYSCDTGYPPVIALQRWSSQPAVWQTVQPFYSNGDRAVFLASDLNSALEQLDVKIEELDGIALTPYTGDIILSNAKIMVKNAADTETETGTDEEPQYTHGDVNGDGEYNTADIVAEQRWLVCGDSEAMVNPQAADLNEDNKVNVVDFCIMKRELVDMAFKVND